MSACHDTILAVTNTIANALIPHYTELIIQELLLNWQSENPMIFADLLILNTVNYPVHIVEMPYFDITSRSVFLLAGDIINP